MARFTHVSGSAHESYTRFHVAGLGAPGVPHQHRTVGGSVLLGHSERYLFTGFFSRAVLSLLLIAAAGHSAGRLASQALRPERGPTGPIGGDNVSRAHRNGISADESGFKYKALIMTWHDDAGCGQALLFHTGTSNEAPLHLVVWSSILI